MKKRVEWLARYTLRKWDGDWSAEDIAAGKAPAPNEVLEREGNLLVTNGRNLLWKGLRGDAITAFSAANARLGVGDSATAEAITQTDLQAATNKLRKAMDSGWPKVGTADGLATDNLMQLQSTFSTGEANWVWAEWGSFNAASGATSMLNRKVDALGTKATGTWQLTVTLSLT